MLARHLRTVGRGSGSFTPLPGSFVLTSAPEGGWHQWVNPKAVSYNGVTYFGYVNNDAEVTLAAWDEATDTLLDSTVLRTNAAADQHDSPAVHVLPDGRIMAVYTVFTTAMHVWISTNPEDISAGTETNIGGTVGGTNLAYPNIVQLMGEANDPIYIFHRDWPFPPGTTSSWYYTKSTNSGATWSARTKVYENSGKSSYLILETDGVDQIHFAATNGSPVADDPLKLGHFHYDAGTWRNSAGTSLGSPPFDITDLTELWDGDPLWPWDIAIDGGDPVVVVAVKVGASDHRYRTMRWNGSTWSDVQIAAAGTGIVTNPGDPNTAAPGIVLDTSNPNRVYACVEVDGEYEMWLYLSFDNGANWSGFALTTSSASENTFPAFVHNVGEVKAMWQAGTYTTYLDYDLATWGTER